MTRRQKNIAEALSEGLAGGLASFLRALVSAFAVWLVLHNLLSPVVSFLVKAWVPAMTKHWGIVGIALTVVLAYSAFMDGLQRGTLRGFGGVPRAFIEHAGATVFGLAGGAVSILFVWLFLFLIFAIAFGWKWERFMTDELLSGLVRVGAPVAFFLGAWFTTNVVRTRLLPKF